MLNNKVRKTSRGFYDENKQKMHLLVLKEQRYDVTVSSRVKYRILYYYIKQYIRDIFDDRVVI